jgi:V/A-type H+-transporting ATPase subunit C
MKSRLLDRQALEELIRAPGVDALIAELEKTSYKEDIEAAGMKYAGIYSIEYALRTNFTRTFNKILGFGGDYRFPELTYAHARMARRNITQVLAGKVQAGLFGEEQAAAIGRALLRDNALGLFPPRRVAG